MFLFPWRARSGPFLSPLRQDSLVQLAWQFEGGKCPLTYLISCTVFLAPDALQIANSRLDLKNLEDTVKLGVYSPTSLTGPRTTGAPAQEIHGNSISVTCVVHIFLLFIHFLPLRILVAYKRPRLGRCWHWPGPHLDESRGGGYLYMQKWGLLGPTSTMHGWLRRTPRMRHETRQL